MKVWVVEQGVYSSRGVTGVYATAEAAMADNPLPMQSQYPCVAAWTQDENGNWDNGLDYEQAISITAFELQGALVLSPK